MMMFNPKRFIGLAFLFLAGILSTGCANKEQFIFSSDENGVICSAKSTFNDTIFYENRFPDSTIYYYVALSKYENGELKKSIENLKTEKKLPKFELHPDGGTIVVVNNGVHFYEANYSIHTPNVKKILMLFQQKAPYMKSCKKVEDFWDVDGVEAPENPVP